jgi:hypothetical protein
VLRATSVADDLGYVALSDLGTALAAETSDYRIIGGHMVTALVARSRLGAGLYRETGDTDVGVPPVVIHDRGLLRRLRDAGYEKVEGNRFARTMTDVPVHVVGSPDARRLAVIDVLIPAYTSRARQNRRVGDDLVTTEVPGLATALRRPAVMLDLELHRLNGERLDTQLAFPDEVAALVLKAFACHVRSKDTDIVDVWRCLEIAFAAGIKPTDFDDRDPAQAAAIVRALFVRRDGEAMGVLTTQQQLSERAADERFTRLRAMIERVLPHE